MQAKNYMNRQCTYLVAFETDTLEMLLVSEFLLSGHALSTEQSAKVYSLGIRNYRI